MSKISKPAGRKKAAMDKPERTMGIDVGDRYSHLCLLDDEGEVVERDRVRSTEAAFRRYFEDAPRLRIALECGTHSPWMSRLLKQLGHQVIVANARKIPTITESESKNDSRPGSPATGLRRWGEAMPNNWRSWPPSIPGCFRRCSIAAWPTSRI